MTALTRCLARCLSVALVVLVLTGASRAVAAKPKAVESSATAEARRHFEVGLTLLKEKNFSAALGEFRESVRCGGGEGECFGEFFVESVVGKKGVK